MNSNTSFNSYEEDEIDLRELFNTIKKNILKIAFFSFIVTFLIILYVLSKPNIYNSTIVLVPQEQSKSSMGGLGALAGLAGVDIGGGGMDAFNSMDTILKDYSFNVTLIKKYNLVEKLTLNPDFSTYVYPVKVYFLQKKEIEKVQIEEDEAIFKTYKTIQDMISLSSDKKSGAITLTTNSENRFLAKELVDIYLGEITAHLRDMDMKDIDKQVIYYEKELANTTNIELRDQLSKLVSGLIQKRVLAQASDYYLVKKITDSNVSYVKNKVKPKRALIVVVAFVTSIILGIFGVFFMEFTRGNKDE
jgi:uncharacterized protein involved in exopolysaccharide biosynthesis